MPTVSKNKKMLLEVEGKSNQIGKQGPLPWWCHCDRAWRECGSGEVEHLPIAQSEGGQGHKIPEGEHGTQFENQYGGINRNQAGKASKARPRACCCIWWQCRIQWGKKSNQRPHRWGLLRTEHNCTTWSVLADKVQLELGNVPRTWLHYLRLHWPIQ